MTESRRMTPVFAVLSISGLLVGLSGCSVVKGGTTTTSAAFVELSNWKAGGAQRATDAEYPKVSREVNTWIDVKATEVELAASTYFTQVDLTHPPELDSMVKAFLAKPAIAGWEEAALKVLEWLKGEYEKSRIKEGALVSAGLRGYRWPDPHK